MNKKIAVFSTAWNAEVIGGILMGMVDKAKELGDDLYIFNNFVGIEVEREFNRCEYDIFNLPDLDRYDGIIILSNAIASAEYMDEFIDKVRASGKPCISIEQNIEGIHFIGTDNYQAMYELVEHLVVDHNCRILNYVGGPKDNIESSERERAFRDVLTKYGIVVEERRIKYKKFTQSSAREAYDEFKNDNIHTPDAVVCANDEMAIGYISVLREEGVEVPADTIVTGFDNSFSAISYSPSITSVGRSKSSLGSQSIEQLMGMIEGKQYPKITYAKHHFSRKCSCGCADNFEGRSKASIEILTRLRAESASRWHINMMQKKLMNRNDENDMKSALFFINEPLANKDFCLMLVPKKDSIENGDKVNLFNSELPEKMEVFFSTNNKSRSKYDTIDTIDIIPEDFELKDTSNVFVISPIHIQGNRLGYLVLRDGVDVLRDNCLFYCVSIISVAIESLRQRVKINELNNRLSRMYIQDSLTSLYNRFALKNYGEPLYERNMLEGNNTLFLFADLDGLKSINDTYGHDAGDIAIIESSKIIKDAVPDPTYFCLRYGGDEVLMIGTCRDENVARGIQDRIKNDMDEFNNKKKYPFKISASTGYVLAKSSEVGNTMDYYIKKADELMYEIKKGKHNQ